RSSGQSSRSRGSSRNAPLGLPRLVVVVVEAAVLVVVVDACVVLLVVVVATCVVVVVVELGFLVDGTQNRGRCDRLTWFRAANWVPSHTCLVGKGALPLDL